MNLFNSSSALIQGEQTQLQFKADWSQDQILLDFTLEGRAFGFELLKTFLDDCLKKSWREIRPHIPFNQDIGLKAYYLLESSLRKFLPTSEVWRKGSPLCRCFKVSFEQAKELYLEAPLEQMSAQRLQLKMGLGCGHCSEDVEKLEVLVKQQKLGNFFNPKAPLEHALDEYAGVPAMTWLLKKRQELKTKFPHHQFMGLYKKTVIIRGPSDSSLKSHFFSEGFDVWFELDNL